jgi:hypothetical protein
MKFTMNQSAKYTLRSGGLFTQNCNVVVLLMAEMVVQRREFPIELTAVECQLNMVVLQPLSKAPQMAT